MKKISIIAVVIIAMIILPLGKVKATLQSNPNTQYTKKDQGDNWIKNIREMEKTGGGMGLGETQNTDLTYSGTSNGIDVHMMKATEYGAIAILSASGYGNPTNEAVITSTTPNNTGMILNTTQWEAVSATVGAYHPTVNAMYYDVYRNNDLNSVRRGDGLGDSTTDNLGCVGWHSAYVPDSRPDNNISSWPSGLIVRGANSIFSYNGADWDSAVYTRGVVVCGEGL